MKSYEKLNESQGRQKRGGGGTTNRKITNMDDINLTISIITFHSKDLNIPIKT